MTPSTARSGTPDLTAALKDLRALGGALIRTFSPGPFPAYTRLSRNICAALANPAAPLNDRILTADIMLRQIDTLQSQVAGIPGIGVLHGHRLIKVADTLAAYRTSMEPEAGRSAA
ncbi:hypothetical protein [Arthrobacter sp. UYCo732]|uniref:hypothetical protein n=1 Tax=Arthrobacter sp. UYCo732 TaxID=3156336 RepID=UPI003394FA23